MPENLTPQQMRTELEQQRLRAARLRVMQTPVPSPATWEQPALRGAAQAQRAKAESTPAATHVAAALPLAAKVAAADRRRPHVENPTIHQADLKTYCRKSFDTDGWERHVRELARKRTRGDPSERMILAVARELASQSRRHTQGMVQMTHAWLAGCARCCKESVRKVVRFLEKQAAFDTFNVLQRVARELLRDANAYILHLPDAPIAAPPAAAAEAPAPAPAAELRPVARRTEALARCVAFFRLVMRPWGLNATPVGTRAMRSERRAAPA